MKRTRQITWIIIAVLLVYAILSLTGAQKELNAQRELTAELKQAVSEAKTENERLKRTLRSMDSDEMREQLARERLGLVMPGDIVFEDVG